MRSIVELRKKSTFGKNVNLPGKMLKSGPDQTAHSDILLVRDGYGNIYQPAL
jgi:hypothetical protein